VQVVDAALSGRGRRRSAPPASCAGRRHPRRRPRSTGSSRSCATHRKCSRSGVAGRSQCTRPPVQLWEGSEDVDTAAGEGEDRLAVTPAPDVLAIVESP